MSQIQKWLMYSGTESFEVVRYSDYEALQRERDTAIEALKAHVAYCDTGLEVDFNHFAHLRDKALREAK